MKYYQCALCQHQLFFENTTCNECQHPIGYVAAYKDMLTFKQENDQVWYAINAQYQQQKFKPCKNYYQHQVCNWFLPADHPNDFCESCQLTHVVPNLNQPENITYWKQLEKAKRRFLYLTQSMNIMPSPKRHADDRYGLRFEFLLPVEDEIILTGHANGVITLNAIEADVVYRETTRVNMGENYRTLLGHFRHESGHYYLDVMQYLHPELIEEFRDIFGDERQDYATALNRHYNEGAPVDWQDNFISTYATAHPWEDWAETWAHYLHMMETLETAYYGGLQVKGNGSTLAKMEFNENPIGGRDFEHILENWVTLTFNLNALNRSMGLDDAYPFQLSEVVKDKLRFIHKHILAKAFNNTMQTTPETL